MPSLPSCKCPKCGKFISEVDPGLPTCSHCEYIFCWKCRDEYHGISSCIAPLLQQHSPCGPSSSSSPIKEKEEEEKRKQSTKKYLMSLISPRGQSSKSKTTPPKSKPSPPLFPVHDIQSDRAWPELKKETSQDLYSVRTRSKRPTFQPGHDHETHPDVAAEAEAKAFEKNYYKVPEDGRNETVEDEEVYNAFDSTPSSPPPPSEWPWEAYESSDLFGAELKYQSLLPERWVEDELLENAIKTIIARNEMGRRVGLLESFVLKYATLANYGDGVLLRVLEEKKILNNDVVFVMVNMDFAGHGGHWVLAIINIQRQTIVLCDTSLVLTPSYYRKSFYFLLRMLHVAHEIEHAKFQANKWRLTVCLDTVQQQNAYDCGPLMVCNAFAIIHNLFLMQPPSRSFKIREWIFRLLEEAELSPKRKEEGVAEKYSSPNGSYEKKISPFAPTDLDIGFDFFGRSKVMQNNNY